MKDGSHIQRKGIVPHVTVQETIAGCINCTDEILETAIKYLQTKSHSDLKRSKTRDVGDVTNSNKTDHRKK